MEITFKNGNINLDDIVVTQTSFPELTTFIGNLAIMCIKDKINFKMIISLKILADLNNFLKYVDVISLNEEQRLNMIKVQYAYEAVYTHPLVICIVNPIFIRKKAL